MTDNSILEDYREDWVLRSLSMKNVDYHSFDNATIYVAMTSESVIAKTIFKIFEEIKKIYHADVKLISGAQSNIIPEESLLIISQESRENVKEIPFINRYKTFYICKTLEDVEKYRDDFVLYCGELYAAGADFPQMNAMENDCTNLLDLFGALIFLISQRKSIDTGIYYAGHGKASESVKYLTDYGYVPMISYEDGAYMLDFFQNRPNERFYFDNSYGGKLKLLQSLLFILLKEFDRICKKYNIRYFLGGGTLLGAIRHGGIIPWDDDMDVMMLRQDYEKFVSVVAKELPESIFFQSSETDEQYHSVFTKLRLNKTRFVTRFSSQFENMNQGIFIDIFVHDKTSKNKIGQKLHVFWTLFVRSMVFHKWSGTPMHFYGRLKPLCSLATAYIKRTDICVLEKIQKKVICFYNKKNTGYLYDGTGEHLKHGAFDETWLDGERMTMFNGELFPVPRQAEQYLQYSYKDYEKWIAASLRKAGHDVIEIDFGPYEQNT